MNQMNQMNQTKQRKQIATVNRYLPLLALLLFITAFTARGAFGRELQVQVTYGQTQARSMLDMINSFRTGSDAWAWNSSDTQKVMYSNLKPLRYDYELEKAAMLRAAELVISYSHTRPDGSSCFTAGGWGTSRNAYGNRAGENIAYGYRSAAAVFTAWQETDLPYSGQGHRRNMLDQQFTSVGIGHVICNGVHYWVQEFGASGAVQDAAESVDGDISVPASFQDTYFAGFNMIAADGSDHVKVQYGEQAALPDLTLYARFTSGVSLPISAVLSWTVEDPEIASIEGGRILGNKTGTTSLSTSYNGIIFHYEIQVLPCDISSCTVTAEDQLYTGSALKPSVTVTGNGKTLSPSDYTVQYGNNLHAGNASVTVKGQGNYTGTASGSFVIRPLDLSAGSLEPISDITYTGQALTPAVTVRVNGNTLKEGTDFTTSWSSNKDAGQANMTVNGKGDYTGSLGQSFRILPADLSQAVLKVSDAAYTGQAQTPAVTITWNGQQLVPEKDYTLTYSNNTEVGTAAVRADGTGNFHNSVSASFKILKPMPVSLPAGTKFTASGAQYQVITQGKSKEATVRYLRPSASKAKATVPSTVTYQKIVYKVTSIYKNAFKNHTEITSAVLGNYVTAIGSGAFYGCRNLKSVTIGSRTASIGKQAFYGCKNLKSITIKSSRLKAAKLGANAFKGIHSAAVFKVPGAKVRYYRIILKKAGAGNKAVFTAT